VTKRRLPALGAEGWFREDDEGAVLIGSRCVDCGTVFFPKVSGLCRNPLCDGTELKDVPLSRRGAVWAATDAHYPPPPPFVVPEEPFTPFAIAAVELAEEGLVVLGQVASGIGPELLPAGTEVELFVDTLFEDADNHYTIWKWRPVGPAG
jgi:uncharacterized OB-fold protein